MKILKYGFFGEDIAQQLFLENYLKQLVIYLGVADTIGFERDPVFPLKGGHRSGVLKMFEEAVQQGLAYYSQEVFFVGIDLDSEKMEEHSKLFQDMNGREVIKKYQNQAFIFIPVQCIEHWLLYLKFKKEHPNSNKNEKYEQIARSDAKKKMYGFARPVMDKQMEVVAQYTENMDIEWLFERSESFHHFHCQLIDFLTDKDTKASR